jgi:hypothetical protein
MMVVLPSESQTTPQAPDHAPPTRPTRDDFDLLVRFLHERDVLCPRCSYNLRNLTQPFCPECREALSLRVDVQPLVIRWLLLTLAPGTFCAILLGIFVFMSIVHGPPNGMPTEAVLTILFMAASATGTVALAVFNRWFMRIPGSTQLTATVVVWVVHFFVFLFITARM